MRFTFNQRACAEVLCDCSERTNAHPDTHTDPCAGGDPRASSYASTHTDSHANT